MACVLALAGVGACDRHRCKPGPVELGQVCTSSGATACQGHNVFTCQPPPEGQRCPVWAPTFDCSTRNPGPLTCGTSGGVATCLCPAPTGDELRVDPVEGGEARSGVRSSGVAMPPACRFRRLGDAVTAANRPGMRVVVASDAARLPATLSGESFPIKIGRGVTVRAESPAQYRLVFDAPAETAAISLAADATLEGLAVAAAAGANPAATAVTCNAGPVTLRSLHLIGRGAGDGTQRMGTGVAIGGADATGCAAAMTGVELEGFGVGIGAGSSGRDASGLAEVTIRDVTTAGLVVNAGRVTAGKLTIEKTAGAAAFGILVDGLSASAPAVLDASQLTISETQQPALEIRAGPMAAAPQVTVTGAQIRKTGPGAVPGIRQLAGTLTLTTATMAENGSYGVRLMGGVATLADVRLTQNADDGLRMEGGTLALTGFVASQNGADGIDISGGQAQLKQGTAEGNTARGLYVWGGMVTVEGPLTIMNNGRGPERATGLRFERGNLIVKGTPATPIEIGNSGLHGVNIEGPGPAGSVAMTGLTVWGSGEYGVNIDLTSPGGHALVADLDVHHNGYGGVAIRRAPSREVDGLLVRGLNVHENGTQQVGAGLWVRGDLGPTLAAISGSTFEGNSDCGIRVSQGPGLKTELALRDNIVRGNNTSGRRSTGGIVFETPATLTAFTGNRIFANKGDQLGFAAPANGGGPWRLGQGGDCSVPTVNQISCYAGAAGINVTADAAIEVDATGVSWQAPDPIPGRDYVTGAQGRVIATAPCAPAMTMCP